MFLPGRTMDAEITRVEVERFPYPPDAGLPGSSTKMTTAASVVVDRAVAFNGPLGHVYNSGLQETGYSRSPSADQRRRIVVVIDGNELAARQSRARSDCSDFVSRRSRSRVARSRERGTVNRSRQRFVKSLQIGEVMRLAGIEPATSRSGGARSIP